jgi:hypothetical protein
VIISVLYLLVRRLLCCLTVLSRGQVSKDAELLLRHVNAVLRRQVTGCGPVAGRSGTSRGTLVTGQPGSSHHKSRAMNASRLSLGLDFIAPPTGPARWS